MKSATYYFWMTAISLVISGAALLGSLAAGVIFGRWDIGAYLVGFAVYADRAASWYRGRLEKIKP